MAIRVTCGGCQKSFAVKDRFAGKKGICPYCGGSIDVPVPEGELVVEGEKLRSGESAVHQSGGKAAGADSSSAVSLAVATEIPKKACPKCQRLNLAGSANCFYCGAQFADGFDPYYKWLGIPRQDQPPHHYRLLGVVLYEPDPDVIQEAADQRMAHVRTHQNGPHAASSQRILNEISTAKVCLINAEKRTAYDTALRAKLAPVSAKMAPMPTGIPVGPRPAMAAPQAPANPMDQFLPPTVWGAPPGYSPPQMGYPGGPGMPMAGIPQAMPMPGGPMPGGPMPGPMGPGGMPMHGPHGGPQHHPHGGMGPVQMARPAQGPMQRGPMEPAVSVTRTPAPRSSNAGLIQGLIAVVVALAIMAVAGYFLNK